MANETPSYLYKLILPSEVNQLLPIPLPALLPLNSQDTRDTFIHLATAKQVQYLIRNKDRFKVAGEVIVLRLDLSVVGSRITWQDPQGKSE